MGESEEAEVDGMTDTDAETQLEYCVESARTWERTIGGSTIEIRGPSSVRSTAAAADAITYTLFLPTETGGIQHFTLPHPTDADWTANLRTNSIDEDDEVIITVPDGTCYERVPVSTEDDGILIYLPDGTALEYCQNVLEGDHGAARALVELFSSPVRIPLVCGVGYDAEQFVSFVSTLADADVHAKSRLHAFRYPLLRGALLSSIGFSIDSQQELETVVDGLDTAGSVGPVTTIDAITDILATAHSRSEETVELVRQLGYAADTLCFRETGRLFCHLLAKDVVTRGLRAAHGRAMEFQWHIGGNYDQRKEAARSASEESRGGAWRELICAAARQSPDEFAYVLANAFYWSGMVSHTDARTQELLFEAGADVARAHDITAIAARAQYRRRTAAGHRFRSYRSFELARQQFEAARDLARNYSFLPEWRPLFEAAIVEAHALSNTGECEEAVQLLEDTIEALGNYDLSSENRASAIRHLEAQKLETKANHSEVYGSQERLEALETARERYETLGFDRSVARVDRTLQRLRREHSSTGGTNVGTADSAESTTEAASNTESAESKDTNTDAESQQAQSTAEKTSTTSDLPASAPNQSSEVDSRDEMHPRDDSIAPSDPDRLESIDYSAPPEDLEDDESEDVDDPYIF